MGWGFTLNKLKSCKSCKQKFTPTKPLQYVCNPTCAIAYAGVLAAKKDKQDTKRRKQESKTKSQWLFEAQNVFNKFIRLRDAHLPCISCGNHSSNQYAAGHYRTVGSAPHQRFDERNVNRQCNRYCNLELSGNIIKYRQGLVAKIGLEAVEQLEADNEPKHYSIDDIIAIKKHYQAKVKEFLNNV